MKKKGYETINSRTKVSVSIYINNRNIILYPMSSRTHNVVWWCIIQICMAPRQRVIQQTYSINSRHYWITIHPLSSSQRKKYNTFFIQLFDGIIGKEACNIISSILFGCLICMTTRMASQGKTRCLDFPSHRLCFFCLYLDFIMNSYFCSTIQLFMGNRSNHVLCFHVKPY